MAATTMKQVEDFLALKRIACVGVSRDPRHFNTMLWQEFRRRRYDAVPVNPNATEIDGQKCYASVKDIKPPVDGVLIMTPSRLTDAVVRDAAEAGVKHVWFYGGAMPGAVTPSAEAFATEKGMDVVKGLCPYMFFPGSGAMHAPHRFWKKLTRTYPRS
jgi:predicted CoA-binding protein